MTPAVRRIAAAIATGLVVVSLVAAPAAAGDRKTLAGSKPGWAKAANLVGHAKAADAVGFRVYLGWRDAAGAEAAARAVSDPRSASYGKYLSSAEFRQQFAPAQGQVGAVKAWLKDRGFDVRYTPGNNHYVVAEGTVAQAEAAFKTTINRYKVNGKVVRSPAKALSVPATLKLVDGVIGLDDSWKFVEPNANADAPPSTGVVTGRPCSAYWAEKTAVTVPEAYGETQPYAPCGYTPAQLRGAYGLTGLVADGLDGSGQTVAIIDAYASPTILADVNQWSSRNGLPTLKPGQLQEVVPPGVFGRPNNTQHDPSGWYVEETLDVEAVHAMAPGAKIVYVAGPNNRRDLDAALNHVIDKHLAQIVTNSYGYATELLPPGYVKPINDMLIQAAATGIGVYFASGDAGDESATFGFNTVEFPTGSPWVTAVGGTSLAVGADDGYLFETGWETGRTLLDATGTAWDGTPPGTFLSGAGGGASCQFAQPWYQVGVVPDAMSMLPDRVCGAFKGRAVPDVSILGDTNTGFLMGQTMTFPGGIVKYGERRVGGTSVSSPLFAGIMAVADQAAGQPHGFANPVFYANATSGAFRDIVPTTDPVAVVRIDYVNGVDDADGTITSLRSMDFPLSIQTEVGYDEVTGVGSPDGESFIDALK